MRERNLKFNVYLNIDEKAMLVEKTGLPFSSLILDYEPKEKPPKEFYLLPEKVERDKDIIFIINYFPYFCCCHYSLLFLIKKRLPFYQ